MVHFKFLFSSWSPVLFFLLFILPFGASAQSDDIVINSKISCRNGSEGSFLIKNGTPLSAEQGVKQQKKFGKKKRNAKSAVRSAKASGSKSALKKAKKRFQNRKELFNNIKACLKGELTEDPNASPSPSTSPSPTPTVTFPTQSRVGSYAGQWNNTTFNSTGPISITFSIAESENVQTGTVAVSFSLNLDLGGNVFGVGDPAAESFLGTFNGVPPYVFTYSSSLFGDDTTVTITEDGDFQLDAANPPASGITDYSMTLDFDDADNSAEIVWSLKLMGMDVNGTGSLSRQ